MTKEELIERLKTIQEYNNPEVAHYEADQALLEFIGDEEIKKLFNSLERWYA